MTKPEFVLGNDGYYEHRCQEFGRLMLTREQMGVYRVAHYQIVSDDSGTAHWEIDPSAGCPWCGHLPDDLVDAVREARTWERRKKK